MESAIPAQILFSVDLLIFLSIVLIHLTKKNISFVYLYALQSLAVVFLLLYSATLNHSSSLWILAILVFALKVVAAPLFFLKLIQKNTLRATANNYLSLPWTLIIIAIITNVANSESFRPLVSLMPANEKALLVCMAAIFTSLFLIINRKGALSQMIGILSLENTILSFALAAGLGQGLGLELGIMFDIFVWIIIASTFVTMIYENFQTLDVTVMSHLKG